MKMVRVAIKAAVMLFLCGVFVTSKASEEMSTPSASASPPASAGTAPPATERSSPRPTADSSSGAPTTPTSTAAAPSTTVGNEPVRHSLGRGFPVPHYHLPDSRWGPFFEEGTEPHNITARVGSTVMIDCRIGLLQNKTVTWLHHKGDSIHLLTVGRSAYSSDERITLSFRYPNNFRLQIVYITRRDEGLYECQVATHPPKVKRIFLKVTAPEVRIVDESGREVTERYYKAGSALELTCLATQVGGGSENPTITWRHGDRTLSKGISSNVSASTDSAISTLTVGPLETRHSGNYTCAVGALAFATVAVHVLNGELPAAVHHGNAAPLGLISPTLVLLSACWLLACQR
ncbi:uncharacterized protein LOC103314654 [Tribolium castaneum]|uniref:uncharacterized protein LOC103314654 n=1 Tax=Tribolium castaneum TaxID=7070 RepID=UPI00046BF340|nr:PREDICTED: uncharacterized protein LOC103314654 [Tribolium castaneum]XP_015836717.1 PREDICTED: uncharacterized protein LOC103314654 [Tribolium castaneum]XP_015836718.1 PREDICTED: uncharacterized protein LOC103314654 [Tribolium castaneum]|eukprot:XP_008199379.1 PREDICTED: uncharacterized protein LOC103314654 [Tribolium castaneum]